VHLATSGMTLFCFFILNGLLYIKEGSKANEECILELDGLPAATLGPLLRVIYGDTSSADQKKVRVPVWQRFLQVSYFFGHFDTKYYFALTLFSALGVFYSPLFFACCFIEILRVSKLMQYVMRAFTANIDQVIAAVILAALVTYLFSVGAYSTAALHNNFNFNSFGGSCTSLKSCTLVALDYGYSQSVFWDYPAAIGTVEGSFFNFAFTFILQIVVPGLISGIIIDTFSELRNTTNAVRDDVLNTCFICNINREDFETNGTSFEKHVTDDHNMWKYLWYIVYLEEKDRSELSGIEQYCAETFQQLSVKWLPIKAARVLSKMTDKYDLYTIYHKLLALQRDVNKVEATIKNEIRSRGNGMQSKLIFAEGERLQEIKNIEISLLDVSLS